MIGPSSVKSTLVLASAASPSALLLWVPLALPFCGCSQAVWCLPPLLPPLPLPLPPLAPCWVSTLSRILADGLDPLALPAWKMNICVCHACMFTEYNPWMWPNDGHLLHAIAIQHMLTRHITHSGWFVATLPPHLLWQHRHRYRLHASSTQMMLNACKCSSSTC